MACSGWKGMYSFLEELKTFRAVTPHRSLGVQRLFPLKFSRGLGVGVQPFFSEFPFPVFPCAFLTPPLIRLEKLGRLYS